MELDKFKELWNEIDVLKEKQQISDEKIKEMLKNKGKTTLSKLIRMAKFSMFAMIPLGILLCFFSHEFFTAGGYYIICPLAFLFVCIVMTPFEIYLYRFLKAIDFSRMTIREVSERILKYQNLVRMAQMYGTIFFFIYLGAWYYLFYRLTIGAEIVWVVIITLGTFYLIMGLVAIPFLYKKLYYKHINRIKESLNELKEFENNNH